MRVPFYRKIVFKVFILVFFVLFGALGINLLLTNKMIDKRMEKRLANYFDSASNTTENFINLVSQTSQMLAKQIVNSHPVFSEENYLSTNLQKEKKRISADTIILVDKNGIILAQDGTTHIVGDSLEYRDIIKQTLKTSSQVTRIAREKETFIIYSSAIIKKDNKLDMILLVGYFINDLFLENLNKNTNLELAFIGNSAVMSSTKWGTPDNLNRLPISYLKYQNLLNNLNSIKEITYKNKTYMVSAKKLKNLEPLISGSILLGFPYDLIQKQKDTLLYAKAKIFYLTIFLALLFIYIIITKYLRAISKLTNAMNSISSKKTYETIIINTKDEFELLANSFNVMGDELNSLHTNMQNQIDKKTNELSTLNKNLKQEVEKEVEKNRKKDQQLIHQSRLAQMGEMISMIAHQWRQPLAAISATSASIELKASLNRLNNDLAIEKAQDISKFSQHLSSTIDDFRDFFKPNKEKKEVTYDEIVRSVFGIIETSLTNKNIQLQQELNCHETFNTYPNELKQVVLNLIKNAEDVLLDKQTVDPTIKIVTYTKKDKYILEVSDNGGGVPEEIIDNIFDPYFSTKEGKDGTGLGLYMSKTIIENHCDGLLSIENGSYGAIFKIALYGEED